MRRTFSLPVFCSLAAMILLLPSNLNGNESLGSAAGTRMTSGSLIMDAVVAQFVVGVSGDLVGGNLGYYTARPYLPGDADGNGVIAISDAVLIINFIFAGGMPPNPLGAGDADCSQVISIGDAVFLINFIFAGGPAPTYCG